jgi:diguanylate cyclase (GGDEF)-like protein/PAS domain S-box-containing protein
MALIGAIADARLAARQRRIDDTEAELARQNLRIDTALNNMSHGLIMFDKDLRVSVCNERYREMYGVPAEMIARRATLREILHNHYVSGKLSGDPDDQAEGLLADIAVRQEVTRIVETGDGRVFQIVNRRLADGGRIASHEDITERHRLYQANLAAEAQLRTQKGQMDAALAHMSQGLCLFDADGRIVLFNRRFLDIYGMSADVVKPGVTFAEMMRHRKAVGCMVDDAEMLAETVIDSVRRGEARDNVMQLSDGRSIRAFNRPLPNGGWVTTYDDVTERIRSQELLESQKVRLDTALDNMKQGLVMYDGDGRLVVWNDRFVQMYRIDGELRHGMTLSEVLALRRAHGMFGRDPGAHAINVQRMVSNGQGFSLVSELNDGRVVSIENQPMTGGGWVSTHEDITERRQAEERLRHQKIQLDTALDNMSQGLLMFDGQSRLVLCNRRYLEMYGLKPEQVTPGISLRELLVMRKAMGTFQRDPDEYFEELQTKLANGTSDQIFIAMPNGGTIAVSNEPMPDGGWVSTHEDITERRRAEERLREGKAQLDTALNTMSQGLNLFDGDNRLVVTNERYREIYRLPADAVKPGVHIEDLVRARVAAGTFFAVDPDEYIAQMRDRLASRKPSAVTMELTDGRTVLMLSQPTADGRGWVVTHEDITDRRRVEKERDRSNAFATSVLENVPTTIIVKDARTMRYVLINRAGERYYNVSRDEMIGKTPDDIFPPETAKMVREHDRRAIEAREAQAFDDHPSLTPAGEHRIVATTRVPILDADGEPQYILSVIQDRTIRKRREAEIARLAHHDMLTGLPNRAAFNACLESTLEAAAKDRAPFVVMSLDVARLKEINDVFGYAVGDRVLNEMSRRIQVAVGGAFVARLGGDEFGIVALDGEQPAAAEQMAQRVHEALAQDIVIDGRHVQSGVSIGIAIYPQNGEDATALVANADAALFRAKSEDRGSYRFFEAEMDKRLRERRALQHELADAIEHGQMALHYQPQARIDGEIFGFEALVRWKHPTRGPISPGTFIPLAEESGLIIPLGEWILREACRQAASWPKPMNIAVNLSPVQFRHGDIAGLVHSVLLETGLAPGRLELEITEGVLIGDYSRALSILRRLKALGVRIAMDDFGTGYSSLSYLQAFPFDKIKIDQAFISNLESNEQSATIVRAVIGLARGFAVPVIAEGVETQAQVSILSREGCDELQGYLIGRPQPIEEYASLVGRPIPLKRKPRNAGAA